MLIRILGTQQQLTWFSVSATQDSWSCPGQYSDVATWKPLEADDVWHYKCINLHEQLQASLGPGRHTIDSVIWHDREGCTTIAGSFHVDDVQYTNGFDAPAGMYCPAGGGSGGPVPCPAGSYCIGGTAGMNVCPDGTYSVNGTGTTTSCTPCAARPGFFCVAGSMTPFGSICPAGFFCLGESSVATPCPGGSYSTVGTGMTARCTACTDTFCPGASTSNTREFPLVRYVRVDLGGSRPVGNVLDMSELLVYNASWTNLARGQGNATNASCWVGGPELAVDGTGLVAQDAHAIFTSCNDTAAWWEVDLAVGSGSAIGGVHVA